MPLYGPKWPLAPGNHDTFELIEDIKEQINFYLRCLLLTSPGENISDPNYGVGLRRFLFEQGVGSISQQIKSIMSTQIKKYIPYISIIEIQIQENLDENNLNFKIIYNISGDLNKSVFDLKLSNDSAIGFY